MLNKIVGSFIIGCLCTVVLVFAAEAFGVLKGVDFDTIPALIAREPVTNSVLLAGLAFYIWALGYVVQCAMERMK